MRKKKLKLKTSKENKIPEQNKKLAENLWNVAVGLRNVVS